MQANSPETGPRLDREQSGQESGREASQGAEFEREILDLRSAESLADLTYQEFSSGQEQAAEQIGREGQKLGFSEEEVQKKLETSGTRAALASLKERAEKLTAGFKRAAVIGTGAVLLSQSADAQALQEFRALAVQEQPAGQSAERKEAASDKITEQQIRKGLYTDTAETLLVRTDADPQGEYQVVQRGGDTFVGTTVDTLKAKIGKGTHDAQFAHTHPLEVLKQLGYSDESVDAMKRGEREPSPTPPSSLDISFAMTLQNRLESKKLHLTSRVFEATGTWDVQVDPKHPSVKTLEKAESDTRKFSKNFVSSLSAAEIKLLQAKGFQNWRPGEHLDRLNADPETRAIGAKFEKATDKFEEKHEQAELILGEIESLAQNVRSERGERQAAVKAYIDYCKAHGISVSYTPAVK